MYKNWIGITAAVTVLTACGGGGGDSAAPASKSELGLQSQTGNPTNDTAQKKLQALYSGKKESAQIEPGNFMQITHDVLYWRDVTQFIVKTDTRYFNPRYPGFLQYNSDAYWLPEEQTCETGSVSLPDLENETVLKPTYDVVYNNCKVGPLVANGKALMHIIGPDIANGNVDNLALELLSGFSIQEQVTDQTYQVQGYYMQSVYGGPETVSMVYSQNDKQLAFVDYGNGNERYSSLYLADYGKVIPNSDSKITDEQGGQITIQSMKDETWIALTHQQGEYYASLGKEFRSNYYFDGKEHARWVKVANSDFNVSSMLADKGPTTAYFDAENVVEKGTQVTLSPNFIDAPDYNLSQMTWQIMAPGASKPETNSQWEKEYTFVKGGEYLITLIATDTHNNSAEFSETIYVRGGGEYLRTETSIEVESDLSEQTPYRAKIALSDNGNYQFTLTTGPAGMTVNEAGVVSWDGQHSAAFQFADTAHYSVTVTDTESQASKLVSGTIPLTHTPKQLESLYHLSGDAPAKALSWKKSNDVNQSMLLSSSEGFDAGISSLTLQNETLVVESNLFHTPTQGKVLNVTYSDSADELVYLYAHEYDYSRLVNFKISSDEAHVFTPQSTLHRLEPYITDLDNDGELEIVNTYSENGVELYNSSYERSVADLIGLADQNSYSKWQECDLDGDGTLELLQTVSSSRRSQLNIISYVDKQLKATEGPIINNVSYYNHTIANMIDLDGDGQCEGVLSYGSDGSSATLGWYVYDGEMLTLEYLSEEYTGLVGLEYVPFSGNYSALIFKSEFVTRMLSFDPEQVQFITLPLEFSPGLDIQLSSEHSTLVGQADLDNDGIQEWVYKHALSSFDPLYTKLGEHYEADNGFLPTHDVVYVAASVEQGQVTPKYRSKAFSIAAVINVLPDENGFTRVITNSDYNWGSFYLTELDAQGNITPLSRKKEWSRVLYRDDGSYYKLDSSEDTYTLYDENDSVMHSGTCTSNSCELLEYKRLRGVTGSYQGIDIVAEPNEHNYLIIDRNSKQVHSYGDNSGITHLVPHPDFNRNGLIFVKQKRPLETTNTDNTETSKFDIPDSGVYRVTRDGVELVHPWKEKVFSQHSDLTHAAVWMNTDSDPELEVVHYIRTSPYNDEYLVYSFSADANGDNVTYREYVRYYLGLYPTERKEMFEQTCLEQSCRQSNLELIESESGTKLRALDRLTGLVIWSRNVASSSLEGDILYYDKDRIYLNVNGLHVIR
ncbi:hypothetical protein [Pseudoalteromonas rubra]|uniref:PKD domain-containing protein n=1 Tax=Pseudoalteromonas rubra TaxID=43658 RepID=A0A0U3IR97_9GAMM|nr:hypothetical protein [Pseudoalteromonas rubra]ALU45852.1 hypothetical protein AT705_23285 [Pseudoalteromonas rubra]